VKILWVSNHSPFQVDFGGGQRSNLIYRTLRDIAEIDVLIIAPTGTPNKAAEELYGQGDGRLEVVHPLGRGERPPWSLAHRLAPPVVDRVAYNLGRRAVDYRPNPAVARAMEQLTARTRYDLFVGRHLKNSGQAGLLALNRAIVDIDDNEIDLYRWIVKDPATKPLRRRVLAARVRKLESLVPKLVADGPALWVTKEEDRSFPGFTRARVLPNIPFVLASQGMAPPPQPYSDSKTILFVGMLSYVFNVQGLDWFLSSVWPAVRKQVPEATFRIVGSRLREEERARWRSIPGVKVDGFVEDISVAYRDCSFVVAPLWSGGGTNIKILEALLHGRACVLTSAAYKGFAETLPARETVLVARNAAEMATQCVKLLGDRNGCRAMGIQGAEAVTQHYSFTKFREVVLETVEEIVGTKVRGRHVAAAGFAGASRSGPR
jgi:glycosyltransferase involved in cell wall biosynthesis